VVQLGVATSEAGAREAFNGFRARYGAALSGASPGIVKAEVNGNTVYRVRTAPMDRADANEACTKVKASGGSCFVARN
jgi:cell division protein FtsN